MQVGSISQDIAGDATATSDQTSAIDQTDAAPAEGTVTTPGTTEGVTAGSVTDGDLLNVNVNVGQDSTLTNATSAIYLNFYLAFM